MSGSAATDLLVLGEFQRAVRMLTMEEELYADDEKEKQLAHKLCSADLSANAQLMLARLLFRQGPWFRTKGEDDAAAAMNELVSHNLLCEPQTEAEWRHILHTVLNKDELLAINKRFNPKTKASLAKPALIASIAQVVNNKNTLFQSTPIALRTVITRALTSAGSIPVRIHPECYVVCVRAYRLLHSFIRVTDYAITPEPDTLVQDDGCCLEAVRIRGGFRLPNTLSPGYALAMNLPLPPSFSDISQRQPLFESRLDLEWLEASLALQAALVCTIAASSSTAAVPSAMAVVELDGVTATTASLPPPPSTTTIVTCATLGELAQLAVRMFLACPAFTARPVHLRRYHDAKFVLADCLFGWVVNEWLEKRRAYAQAVEVLRVLVDCPHLESSPHGKRALWYQRLMIDLAHLKQSTSVRLLVCRRAVKEFSKEREVMWRYFSKMVGEKEDVSGGAVFEDEEEEEEEEPEELVSGLTVRTVEARPFLKRARGAKQLFLRESDCTEVTCSVEMYALELYASEGGWQGYHLENYVFMLMFKLLMRPVCFGRDEEEAALFERNLWVYNSHLVLDLKCAAQSFAKNRAQQIAARLGEIAAYSSSQLAECVKQEYELAAAAATTTVKLSLELDAVQRIACGMGSARLAKLCHGFCHNYAALGNGGAPDLLLIRPSGGDGGDGAEFDCRLVEVKSENDRLSEKQVFWIHFLQHQCGFDVDVLKIKPPPKPSKLSKS